MLRCNLAILLSERNLKITKVAKDTGISRTTLTSLSSNSSKGIQLDTMNTLCHYLSITPDKLFSFIPLDIDCEVSYLNDCLVDDIEKNIDILFDITLKIHTNSLKPIIFDLNGNIFFYKTITHRKYILRTIDKNVSKIDNNYTEISMIGDIEILLDLPSFSDEEITIKNNEIKEIFKKIPTPFLNDFSRKLENEIIINFENYNERILNKANNNYNFDNNSNYDFDDDLPKINCKIIYGFL